jgi:hypothetical protein
MADLRAMSEHVDRKEAAAKNRTYSTIKTTPEQIVRDFRRNEGFNTYEAAGMMRPLCRKIRRPFFLKRWFNAVNWDFFYELGGKAIEWACIGVTVACLVYLGIFVFGPFAIKLLK